MKTPTREQQLQMMQQLQAATRALASERGRALREMTEKEALQQAEDLLTDVSPWRSRSDWSGLVEQQAVFKKAYSK